MACTVPTHSLHSLQLVLLPRAPRIQAAKHKEGERRPPARRLQPRNSTSSTLVQGALLEPTFDWFLLQPPKCYLHFPLTQRGSWPQTVSSSVRFLLLGRLLVEWADLAERPWRLRPPPIPLLSEATLCGRWAMQAPCSQLSQCWDWLRAHGGWRGAVGTLESSL